MKAKSLCDFKHENVDYKKGAVVDLSEKQIASLAKVGLVELEEVETTPGGSTEPPIPPENPESPATGESKAPDEEKPEPAPRSGKNAKS